MRQLSQSVRSSLDSKLGINTTVIVGVEWVEGSEVYYSSTDYPGANKSVISITDLETTVKLEGSSATQSVTVTLSDTDGKLTEILNTVDVHKRPAKLYLTFDQIPVDQSVVMIDGEINSEIEWDDAARTLTFTILSKIEGRQFGFSAEDGLFHKVDPNTRTTPWPFRFGDTCAYPAVRIQNGVSGVLKVGQGVLDPTLDAKICQARQIQCPLVKSRLSDPVPEDQRPGNSVSEKVDAATKALAEWKARVAEDPFAFNVSQLTVFGTQPESPLNANGESAATGEYDPDDDVPLVRDTRCERERFKKLCQLLRDRANQLVYVQDTLQIENGNDFPQGQLVTIRVDDVQYTGWFSGETFTIETTNRLDRPEEVDCTQAGPLTKGYRPTNESEPSTLEECENPTNKFQLRVIGGAGEAWRALDEHPDSRFKWLPSGTKVYLEQRSKEVHVVSLVPGTVEGVYAYRKFGDVSVLTELPTDYYEVVVTDYGDLEAVEVHLSRPLSSYPDENWEGTIYVVFDSDIGPNPVDVMEWIIDRYTDFTIDTASFASVKSKLTKYPCNYYYARKESVLSTLSRIAYEARCAIIVTDNIVKLVYLPDEPTSIRTLNTSNVVSGSFSFKHTRTEELVTSQTVRWQNWGAPIRRDDEVVKSLTVENNVEKYGFFGAETTYETINIDELALKTATFWSIRDSNTYRIVNLKAGLENLDLELFDCVTLDLPNFPNVKTIVTSMSIDPESGVVDLELWTPVLSGTTEAYFFAWPASQPVEPYPSDNYDIPEPKVKVTPPIGHPLYVDPNSEDPVVSPTVGDRFPSDLDDSVMTITCQDVTDPGLVDVIEPQFNQIEFLDAQEEARHADEVAADNTSYNFKEPQELTVCGRTTYDTCVWEVQVQYGNATIIAPVSNPGGSPGSGCGVEPGPCSGTASGQRCGGQSWFWCRTFGSDTFAKAYVAAIQAQIDAGFCKWTVGKTGPLTVTGPIKRSGSGILPCVPMGDVQLGQSEVPVGD